MSDTDRPMQSAGPYVHYCHCGEWGGYGFSSAAAIETRWWCWAHYPHRVKDSARQEAASIADALGTIRRVQGS